MFKEKDLVPLSFAKIQPSKNPSKSISLINLLASITLVRVTGH